MNNVKTKNERNEKSFVWHDMKISTVFGYIYPEAQTGTLHTHSQFEMFVFKAANGYLKTDNDKIKLSRNNLIIVPPNTNHAFVFEDSTQVKGMSIRFYYKKIKDRRQYHNGQIFAFFDNLMPQENSVVILKDKYFGQFYNDFLEEKEANPLLASSLITHMLEGLFLHILRCITNPRKSNEPVSIYSYKTAALNNDSIIATNIEEFMGGADCTLEALANYLKMSPRNVQRILKKTYNKSFTEKLAEIRLTSAIDLMTNSSLSLREIAERSNYNKYDSFRKAFAQKYGISPAKYREKL